MYLPSKKAVIGTAYFLFRWFLFLFSISVSTTATPCVVVNSLGLFGEVKASAIICEEEEGAAEAAVKQYKRDSHSIHKISAQSRQSGSLPAGVKGVDIFNIWFVLSVVFPYFCYVRYSCRLPEEDTIVTLKVRMDN